MLGSVFAPEDGSDLVAYGGVGSAPMHPRTLQIRDGALQGPCP